jgi:NADH-quinone oxidoreductase subunit I
MIQAGVIYHLQNRMDGAGFRVIGAVHQAAEAGMNRCSGAHGARLNCSKQFAVAEPVVTEVSSRLAQRHDFRVSGGIGVGEILIPSSTGYTAGAHDDRSHGHFARLQCALGAAESLFHPKLVGGNLGGSVGLQFFVTHVTPAFCRQCYSMQVMGMTDILRKVFLWDLAQGLGVTFRYQHPKEIYTEQYPLERPQVAERYRGAPRLNVNPDTDETLCISCDLCALACPENLIVVTSERNEKTRRKELTNFTYDLSRCMFCGLCEDACPTDALELTQDFELASYTREGMIWDRQTLEKGPQPTVYQK